MRAYVPTRKESPSRARRFAVVTAIVALVAPVLTVAGDVPAASGTPSAVPAQRPTGDFGTAPPLTAQTFADPPASVRPKYYWWMPLANTDDKELAAELHAMAQAGAGGALIVPQRTNDRSASFLAKYGWGTPLWRHRVETMLAAAHANGIQLDFSQGPAWPAVVPTVSDVNDPRAMQQLIFSYEFHTGGTSRKGPLPDNFDVSPPADAKKTLVAALVARCAKPTCATHSSSPRTLERSSVVDVTDDVDSAGNLHYQFPAGDGTYALIAFYQTATGQKRSGLTATSPNYYLDYLSVAGAKATTDYFDQHILTPRVQRLITENHGAGFYENSLELGHYLKWTWGFAKQFHRLRGYSMISDLPALTSTGVTGVPAAPAFDFSDGSGARVRYDYLRTVSDLYIHNHLDTLRAWAHSHDLHLRTQPYGPPIDIPEASAHLDVPAGEALAFGDRGTENTSLAFGHNRIEDYKTLAVGAHLNGTSTVAAECCESQNSVWADTAAGGGDTANLRKAYAALAGGATRIVWHGYPYLERASGPQSHWPGMSYGGNHSWSSAFGPNRGPNWSDYRQINDNLARLGLVLSQGKPRFDVAVYLQEFGLDGSGTGTTGVGHNKLIPSGSAMASAGYTYEYLTSALLQRKDATFRHGALFSDRSAYKALVLNNQSTMPVDTARKILRLAEQGMPVAIIGNPPATTPGGYRSASQDARLGAIMRRLVAQRSVYRVPAEADVPTALRRAGVVAAAKHATASPAIVSVRRHTETTDYYYLYNQSPTATDQTLTLTGRGLPYRLNTWTGKISRISNYTRCSGRCDTVTLPIHLHAHDTAVIAISHGNPVFERVPASHPVHAPASTASLAPRKLTAWSLKVDSWTPGPSDQPGTTTHTKLGPVTLSANDAGELPPWSAITPAAGYAADLRDVSGIGTYTTHVDLGPGWRPAKSVELNLGRVVDTSEVIVNGQRLPSLDYTDLHHIDVGRYLHGGENTITVRVASTLLNAVRVAPGTDAADRQRMDYGLLGPVTLTPIRPVAAEALETELPLAAGGFNRADVRITNHTTHSESVEISASAAAGITTRPQTSRVSIGAGKWTTVGIELRNSRRGSGTSQLHVTVRDRHGAEATTTVTLRHSADLARNELGTPYPRVFASGTQGNRPPELAIDNTPSTFWVANGEAPGQGPSASRPDVLGVDLGALVEISAVSVTGRSHYGPTSYDIQTSNDRRAWHTVATVPDASSSGVTTTPFHTVSARYVRLRITGGGDPKDRNVQVSNLQVFAPPTAGADLLRTAEMSASSTHSGFSAGAAADGLTDSSIWTGGPGGGGWNDGTYDAFPDTLTGTWAQPVTVGRVRIYTLNSTKYSASRNGVRDVDIQARVDGSWRTIAQVRGNTDGVIGRSFTAVTTDALRLVVLDSNDHEYSRVVEFQAYTA